MSAPGRGKAGAWTVRAGLGLLTPAALLVLWQLASRGPGAPLPPPAAVLRVLLDPFAEPRHLDTGSLAASTLVSLLRVLFGFGAAAGLALPLGLLIGWSARARSLLGPLLELLRPVSPIAWLPVAILLLGFASLGSLAWGSDSWKYPLADHMTLAVLAIIAWGAFFPILLNTAHGVSTVRRFHLEVAATLGARRAGLFRHVILPAALPDVLVGLRLGFGRALMVLVAAEFFPGTRSGLGRMITAGHDVGEYAHAFAAIVVISVLGLATDAMLQALAGRAGRWRVRER